MMLSTFQFQFSCSVMSDSVTPWAAAHQASLSITNSWNLLNSSPSSQWCHPTISSSVVPFSSCLQSFKHQSLFQSQLFASGGQSIGTSALASVIPMSIQDWFPLGLTGLILQSKGLSWGISIITVWTHQFFCTQPSLWSNSHIRTWLLDKPQPWQHVLFVGKVMSLLFNMLSRFVIAFLPRSKCLLISWLQSVHSDFGA